MERSKKLFNNSVILLTGSVFTKGLNFIMAPLFTRWLTTVDYGTFDLLATYSTLLIPILALGIHHAVFRFLLDNDSKQDMEIILTNTLLTNFIGIIIYIIFVSIISLISGKVSSFLALLTIMTLTQTFQNYLGMFIRGIKNLKLFCIANIICTASILISVFIFVYVMNLGLNGMILGYSMGYFLGGITGVICTKNYRLFKLNSISLSQIKKMLVYAVPMIPNSIAWWIINVSDRMIVSMVLGVSANAVLAVAHKIPNLCTTIYEVFQTAWIENATESIKDKDWNNYFNKMLNIMGQFCTSISIIIVTTNFFLFDLLFTDSYKSGKYIIPLFAFAIIFAALSQCIGSVFIAEYNSKQQGMTMLIAGIINIIVHLLLINFIGIYASAVSTITAYISLFSIRYQSVRKKYTVKLDIKTTILISFLLIYILLSYIDKNFINVLAFVSSIIICIIANKPTIIIILKNVFKNENKAKAVIEIEK